MKFLLIYTLSFLLVYAQENLTDTPIHKGLSASIFSIETNLNNHKVITKKFKDISPENFNKEIAAITSASNNAFGPTMHEFNNDLHTITTDYIEGQYSGIRNELNFFKLFGQKTRILHEQCPDNIPHEFFFDFLKDFDVKNSDKGIKDLFQETEYNKIYFFIDEARKIFTQLNVKPGLCHRDLNPNNIIYNDQGLFLIDWEYCAIDIPFIDCADFLNFYGAEMGSEQNCTNCFIKEYCENSILDPQCVLHMIIFCRPFAHWIHAHMIIKFCLKFQQDTFQDINIDSLPFPEFENKIRKQEINLNNDLNLQALAYVTLMEGIQLLNNVDFKESYAYLKNII
jgi:thiamine kinase-like enzyme